jgi:hypothetical protein
MQSAAVYMQSDANNSQSGAVGHDHTYNQPGVVAAQSGTTSDQSGVGRMVLNSAFITMPVDNDDVAMLTNNIEHYAAVTHLPDGRKIWVLDQTGPITHNEFIQYLADMHHTFILIREDGCHIHLGTDIPMREASQSDRPMSFMTNRGGRWYFNDAHEDENDDDIFGEVVEPVNDEEMSVNENVEVLDVYDDVDVLWGACVDRTNVNIDSELLHDPAEYHRVEKLSRKRIAKTAVKLLMKRACEVSVGSAAAQILAHNIIQDYKDEMEASKEN